MQCEIWVVAAAHCSSVSWRLARSSRCACSSSRVPGSAVAGGGLKTLYMSLFSMLWRGCQFHCVRLLYSGSAHVQPDGWCGQSRLASGIAPLTALTCPTAICTHIPSLANAEPAAVPCWPRPAHAMKFHAVDFSVHLLYGMRHCKQRPPTNRDMKSASVRPKRSVASAVGSSAPSGCRNAALSVTGAACDDQWCDSRG